MTPHSAPPNIYSLRKGAVIPPAQAVYVGRFNPRRTDCPKNPWSNPFRCEVESDDPHQLHSRAWACAEFEKYAAGRLEREPGWLDPLRGKDLVCWCKNAPDSPVKCHAEILIRLANREIEK